MRQSTDCSNLHIRHFCTRLITEVHLVYIRETRFEIAFPYTVVHLHEQDLSDYFLRFVLFFDLVFKEILRIDLVFFKSMQTGENNDTLMEQDYFFESIYF